MRFPAIATTVAILIGGFSVQAEDKKPTDKAFDKKECVSHAASCNMKMVELGKIMREKAKSAEVKQFASQMVEAHTKMMDKLKTTCKEINCEFPEKPVAEDQKIITQFRDEKSQNLDEAYMKHMVETHENAVKMLTQAHKEAKDPQLQKCSGEAMKVLEDHLKKAQTILKDLKA